MTARRWRWLVGLVVAGALVAVVAVSRSGWTLTEMQQAAGVGSLIVAVVVAVWGFRPHEAAGPSGPSDLRAAGPAGGLSTRNPLDGLPRLGDKSDKHMAVGRLGVHPAIPLPASAIDKGLDGDLPTWVERDLAGDVRGWLATAKDEGGFLVLAGDSSVGKTRLLYEAASEVLAGWPVLVSAARGDGTAINELAARADELDEGVVVWLDELQRYLPGPYAGKTPIDPGALPGLRNAPAPVIVLGTLWPQHLRRLRSSRQQPDGSVEQYPEAADALRDVPILTVPSFNMAEAAAARVAGADDPRLATAAGDLHFGVTQTLAGAPAIIERYETTRGVERALVLAAIDAQRLGLRPPLGADLLTAAARGYLTEAHLTDEWAKPALDELSRHDRPEDRATALLQVHYDPTHRQVIGYEVADYLLEHATRARRSERVPDATWQALTEHSTDPEELRDLGVHAQRRGLDRHAEATWRKAAGAGDTWAMMQLTGLWAERGDPEALDELRARAGPIEFITYDPDGRRSWAADRLAELLAARGDPEAVEELRVRADAGDGQATFRLAELLAARGDPEALEELRTRADTGDRMAVYGVGPAAEAADRLAELLAARGDREALEELRALADAGDVAADRLADLVAAQADREAREEARARVIAGRAAADWLALLLPDRGDPDAVEDLRTRADAGDTEAAHRLALLLADRGDFEGLRAEVDAGTPSALRALRRLEEGGTSPG